MTEPGVERDPAPSTLTRVLGHLGLRHTGTVDGPSDPSPRSVGRPLTVGQPILPSPSDDALNTSSWTSQPRISADGGSFGTLTVRAASVSGRRHARQGSSREDAFALGRARSSVVIAVADGVGADSARYSAVGAQIAAVEACRILVACLDNNFAIEPAEICRQISTTMTRSAANFISGGYDEQSLATTLTVAWISTSGRYDGFIVGDGEIFEVAAAHLTHKAAGKGSAFAETAALPASYEAVEEFSGRLKPATALIAVTDGLAGPMRSPDVSAHLASRWQQIPTVVEFLDDVSFERRGESDDRTAVSVWFDPVNSS